MGPLPQPEPTDITIKPITSEEDLPICAYLADVALKPDGLHEFKARYGTANVYTETLARLTESLHDQQRFRLFKAVVPSHLAQHESPSVGADPSETIVGFAQYRYGYIETSKVDPFKPQQETPDSLSPRITATNVTVPETDKQPSVNDSSDKDDLIVPEGALTTQIPKPFYSDPDAELGRKLGNAYIGTIRGKRHIYLHRLLVHPSYQRKGIGQKLLDWGVETADQENIVAWLFCRPPGYKLYDRNGWKVVSTIEVHPPDEDLKVAPVLAMLRLPAGRKE